MILRYTLRCLRFSCSLKNSWLIISAVDFVNDILSFMINFHPYYIQERPVRSIIIINIIVIVVIIIYYCYRIIVISHPHYLCVVWLVSITQPNKGWYSWLYSLAGTIKTNQNSFFLWQQHYSHHPNPPPLSPFHLSILKLWFNSILGLNFIFFCFKLIITHYHTQKPTYLGNN